MGSASVSNKGTGSQSRGSIKMGYHYRATEPALDICLSPYPDNPIVDANQSHWHTNVNPPKQRIIVARLSIEGCSNRRYFDPRCLICATTQASLSFDPQGLHLSNHRPPDANPRPSA